MPLAAYARPGAFNDPDMLEIGNGALTPGENRMHFSVWSILSAPLIAGNDLTTMTDETLGILTNSRLIGVNQDPLGLQAALIRREGDVEILAKPLAECGARAVVLWNRGETSAEVSVGWEELWLERGPATVHDLWSDERGRFRFGRLQRRRRRARRRRVARHGRRAAASTRARVPQRLALDVRNERLRSRRARSDQRGGRGARWGPDSAARCGLRKGPRRSRPFARSVPPRSSVLAIRSRRGYRRRPGRARARPSSKCGPTASACSKAACSRVRARPETVLIDVRDKRELRLFVGVGGDTNTKDHAVWAGARLECDTSEAAPE